MPMTDNCIRHCYGIVSFSRRGGSYLEPVSFFAYKGFQPSKKLCSQSARYIHSLIAVLL